MADEQVEHWPNGRIREIARRVNGEQHGRQQRWYEDGQPEYDLTYEHGKEHGRHRAWYPDGQLEYDINCEYDVRHGRTQGWYEDGQPSYDRTYENGVPHGSIREWDAQGKLTRDAWYERGAEWRERVPAQRLLEGQKDVTIMALLTLVASYV